MDEQERLKFAGRLQNAIVVRESIPLPYAAILAHHVMTTFDERVMKGIMLWLDDRLGDDFSVKGVSIGEIRDAYGACTAFVALNIMDLSLKDPDAFYDFTWFEGVDEIV